MRTRLSLLLTSWALALLGVAFSCTAAHAYGTEGLFGGRLSPDSTITINNPVDVELRPERAESVLKRPRPDFDPVPVTLGAFDLFPSLEGGASYDSNIYAAKKHTSDVVTTEHPAINAVSNWGRHQLAMTAFGDINQYVNHTHENFQDFATQIQGRYDVTEQTWLSAHGGYQYLTEPRYSSNSQNGTEPTTFNLYQAGATAYRGVGIIQTKFDYDVHHYSYNNTPSTTGTIDESFRNRTEQTVTGTVFYASSENFKPYVSGTYNNRTYDNNQQKLSDGYSFIGGSQMDFGGVTSLNAFAGWMSQNYRNFPSSKLNQGLKYGGVFNWNITGLTSLAIEGDRTIEETPLIAYDSYKATGGSATLTHELFRNLLIEGDAAFTSDNFQGTGPRHDNLMSAGGGTRWLLNRNLYVDTSYLWTHRVSDLPGFDFVDHQVTMRLGFQL